MRGSPRPRRRERALTRPRRELESVMLRSRIREGLPAIAEVLGWPAGTGGDGLIADGR